MRAKILAALLSVSMAGAAVAAPVAVPLNHSVRLSLAGPAGSVVVGNPNIADVTVVDSRTLFLQGKGLGTTDVVVVDPLGRTVFSADVIVDAAARGQVAVYRGGSPSDPRTNMACDPRCEVATGGSGRGSSSGMGAFVSGVRGMAGAN